MNPIIKPTPRISQRQQSFLLTSIKQQQSINSISQKQPDYYSQFCKLYLANTILETHLKQLNLQKTQLVGKLTKLEKKAEENQENSNSANQRKKRIRRSAADIARHYKCPHENCSKSYGSQGSLNQHIKLKHPQLFKTLNIAQSMVFRDYQDSSFSQSKQ